ncbi:hypothetical protein Gotur_022513 [Gossypium turneri]
MQSVPRLVGFSDLKLMKILVCSELIWMSRDHFEEVFLFLLVLLVKCRSLLSTKIYRYSALDAEDWGHGLSNCTKLTPERISKISENPPYSLALKAESKLFGKESINFNAWIKKVRAQCSYTGGEINGEEEGLMRLKKDEESKVCPRKQDHIKYEDKANWKRTQSASKIMKAVGEANMRKRKSSDANLTRGHKENVDRVKFKRLK